MAYQVINYYGIRLPIMPDGTMGLSAILTLKLIDEDGQVQYREFHSDNLHPIEGLGMLETHADTLRAVLMGRVAPPE